MRKKVPSPANPRRKLVIAIAVAFIGAAVAVPQLVSALQSVEDEGGTPAPLTPAREPAPELQDGEPAEPLAAPKPDLPKAVAAAPKPAIETSKDGDLALALKFRWLEFEAGERILAKIRFTNHTLAAFYLPGAGEASPGLAIVVEDADGAEVRRVVETGKEQQLPRRLAKLGSGAEVEMPIVVVAEGETPLAPGSYTAYVELRPDPALRRLGLPLWSAPKGAVRSEPVPLVVTPKTQ